MTELQSGFAMNAALALCIAIAVFSVALFAHSADGLWALVLMLAMVVPKKSKCKCSETEKAD